MFRTPKVGTRALAGLATFATVTGVMVPLMAAPASAATTGVTVDALSKTANNRTVAYQGNLADTTHTITGTIANDANGPSLVRFVISSGPNADLAANGASAGDGNCAVTVTDFSCAYTDGSANGASKTGVDTIRVFADVNENNILDSGEPSDTASKTWSGAPFSLALTPDSDTAAQGTCNPFTAVVRDAQGNPVATGTRVDVEVTQTSPTTATDVAFCDATADGGPGGTNNQTAPLATPNETNAAIGTSGRRGEFVTDDNGTLTFGIVSNNVSQYKVLAYAENDDPAAVETGDNALNAGEPNDASTKSFTAGTAEGVTKVVATPETATNFVNEQHTITATLTNASGNAVSGVTPLFDVTSGPNATANGQVPCSVSNQAGKSTCSYTGTTAGTDTIIVFVNQASGATPGPDATEPQDTVQKTYVAGKAGTQIDLTCKGTVAGGTAANQNPVKGSDNGGDETCVNPTTAPNETFTVYVSTPGTNGQQAAAGVPVNFTVTPTGANAATTAADVTPKSGTVTTGSDGTATFTVNNPSPADGDSYSVKARTANDTTTVSDEATKTYQKAVADDISVTPEVATNKVNTSHSYTVTVTDQFGVPVAGQNVDTLVQGRNNLTRNDLVTDASGKATTSYTDTGSSLDNGSDGILAIVDLDNNNATNDGPGRWASKYWITENATPGTLDLDIDDYDSSNPSPNADNGCEQGSAAGTAVTNADLRSEVYVCATVRTASGNNVLAGTPVTFTINGVGTFDNGQKTITVNSDSEGIANTYATSTQSGTQNITVTAGNLSRNGSITYRQPTAQDAYNVDLKPETSNQTAGKSIELTARVTDRFGNPVPGVDVSFTETGVARFSNGTSSADAVTGSTGIAAVTLVTDAGTIGTDTVSANITDFNWSPGCTNAADPNTTPPTPAGNCADSSVYTFQKPGQSARTLDLTPPTATAVSGKGTTFTATAKDANGVGVEGAVVTFQESGTGGFAGTSSSTTTATTNANGVATVTTTSGSSERGTQTVTASIAAADTDCGLPAGTPAGSQAGRCSDSSTVTYSPAGSAPKITVSPTVLTVPGAAKVTVTGTPGQAVELLAYSRPSTKYVVVRKGIIPSTGKIAFTVRPTTNTRLYARTVSGSSASSAISVRPAVTLFAKVNGRVGTFTGKVAPGRNGVIVTIYYVKGGKNYAAGTARVNNGAYSFSRTFAAPGQTVTFFAQTRTDTINLSGRSGNRTITFGR